MSTYVEYISIISPRALLRTLANEFVGALESFGAVAHRQSIRDLFSEGRWVSTTPRPHFAEVAQVEEQLISDQKVGGANPSFRTISRRDPTADEVDGPLALAVWDSVAFCDNSSEECALSTVERSVWRFESSPTDHYREHSSMVEQLILNQHVEGSIPSALTIHAAVAQIVEQPRLRGGRRCDHSPLHHL